MSDTGPTSVVKITAYGCSMRSRIESSISLQRNAVNRGRTAVLTITLRFDAADLPKGLEVQADPALGLQGQAFAISGGSLEARLELDTDCLETGAHGIEVRVEHKEYRTTLSESNRLYLEVLPPALAISSVELASEQEKWLDVSVLINSSSKQRTKTDLELDLVSDGKPVTSSKKRISATNGTKALIQVPRKGLRLGTYDVAVRLLMEGKVLASGNFTSGIVLKARCALEIISKVGHLKVSAGQSFTFDITAKNSGAEALKTRIDIYGQIGAMESTLCETETELGPGEAKDIVMEAVMAPDAPNGPVPLTARYALDGKMVTLELKDMALTVTGAHDLKVLSCLADLDFYTPGDPVVLRVYLKDEGGHPGLEAAVGITIKDPGVRYKDSKSVFVGDKEALALFEWESPENLKAKRLDVEVSVDGMSRNFESVIRFEEPVGLMPLFTHTKPSDATAKDKRNDHVADYLCEQESVTRRTSYRFLRKGKKHTMDIFCMDSGTKMAVLDGKVCCGLDNDSVPFDEIFSHLVLTRIEDPKTIASLWQRLDQLGYMGTCDMLNILEELLPGSLKGRAPGIQDWEDASRSLLLDAKAHVKKMGNGFLVIQAQQGLGPKKPDPRANKLLERLDLAMSCLKERDTSGFERDMDTHLKGLDDIFSRRIEYDRSEHDPEDAHRMLLWHILASWTGQLPYILRQREIYREASTNNFLGPSQYVELIRARIMLHVLLAQRYHVQTTLDAYSPSEPLRRAVGANLDLVRRLGKNLSLAFGLTKTLTDNISANRANRNDVAYITRHVSVASKKVEMRGTLGSLATDMMELSNTGDRDASMVVTVALPSEDWCLVEPAFNLEGDAHVSPPMSLKKGETRQLPISVQIPKGASIKSIKFIIMRSAQRRELASLTDARLTSEAKRVSAVEIREPSPRRARPHPKLREFLNDYHRIRFFLAHIEAHRLSRKERGIFVDDAMVFERYKRLRNIKDDSLLEALEDSKFFKISSTSVSEGLIFKNVVESPSLALRPADEVSCDEPAVAWAGGSIYLSDLVMRSMLPQLKRAYSPSYEIEGLLDPLPTGYQAPEAGREYLYEREIPGMLEKYAKGTGAGSMSQKEYTKKHAETLRFEGGLLANSLQTWVRCIIDSKPEAVLGHLERGDFESWLRKIGSGDLANVINGFWARTKEDLKDGSARPSEVKRLLFERLDKTPLKVQINEYTIKPLVRSLCAPGSGSRIESIERLTEIGDRTVVEPLIERLFDQQEGTRRAAIQALGRIGDKRAIVPLEKIVSYSTDPKDRELAGSALSMIKNKGTPISQ